MSVNASDNGIMLVSDAFTVLYSNINVDYDDYWSEQFGTNIYFKANPI